MNFIGAGDLLKAADVRAAQIADANRRLAKIEAEDERRRNFWEAEALAPASANWHKAPARLQ
jgi:hypothetical protein